MPNTGVARLQLWYPARKVFLTSFVSAAKLVSESRNSSQPGNLSQSRHTDSIRQWRIQATEIERLKQENAALRSEHDAACKAWRHETERLKEEAEAAWRGTATNKVDRDLYELSLTKNQQQAARIAELERLVQAEIDNCSTCHGSRIESKYGITGLCRECQRWVDALKGAAK